MFIRTTKREKGKSANCRAALPRLIVAALTGGIGASSLALAETNIYISATQVMTFSNTESIDSSSLQAIGGTRLRAIGGTRLRAEDFDDLHAIGGTFLRAIGGTRLRNADGESEQLAIGGTRLRTDDESTSQAIGGTRLRAIGGTRLRADGSSDLLAIGGTRLRAIGGTRLRSGDAESAGYAIGGTRLRAIGGTRLRSDDIQSVQAIGGTRLRGIESDSSLEAIGGTRLRAIGGTRLRAIGGTRLRAADDTETATLSSHSGSHDIVPSGTAVALLLEQGETLDVFAYGPITSISGDNLEISVLGQTIELTSGTVSESAQLGQVALIAGTSSSNNGIVVLSDQWHVPGATKVSLAAHVTSIDTSTATFTVEGGIVVDYSGTLANESDIDLTIGSRVLISGFAY